MFNYPNIVIISDEEMTDIELQAFALEYYGQDGLDAINEIEECELPN